MKYKRLEIYTQDVWVIVWREGFQKKIEMENEKDAHRFINRCQQITDKFNYTIERLTVDTFLREKQI